MAHTKGKFEDGSEGWKVAPFPPMHEGGKGTYELHFSDDGECVAEIIHSKEDAELIAAAPDMLVKLKQCINAIESSGAKRCGGDTVYTPQIGESFLKTIYSVIKKAEKV